MKKIWLLVLPLLFIMGCKIETEVWLENDGTGHALMTLTEFKGYTEDKIKKEIIDPDMEIVSMKKIKEGNFEVKVKWKDFKKAFDKGEFKKEKNGNIFVNFGKIESMDVGGGNLLEQKITVHVKGKILKTAGEKIDDHTVVFTSGETTLTYKPYSSSPVLYLIIIVIIVLLLIAVLFLLVLKGKRSKQN